MTIPTTRNSHNDWLDNQEVLDIKTIASGVVAGVAGHNHSFEPFRVLFKPNKANFDQAGSPGFFQIGMCFTRFNLDNLLQTIACELNSDYFDLVMTVRRIFSENIKNVVDAVGVPDGIIAVVENEEQKSYQLIHVSTVCTSDALGAKTVLLENMSDLCFWEEPDDQIRFHNIFFAPMYEEAVRRQSEVKNHWMHVPSYQFLYSTLDFYMHEECVETISQLAGASNNIDYRDWQGNTALHFSTGWCFERDVSSPLRKVCITPAVVWCGGLTPLHKAICNNNILSVLALLNGGIDPNEYFLNGDSLSSYCKLVNSDNRIEQMIHVYLVNWAARKTIEEIRQSALL